MIHRPRFCQHLPISFGVALLAAVLAVALTAPTLANAALQDEEERGVSISAFSFVPATLTVNVGDSVTWVNTDGVPHTSTAASNHLWGDLMTSSEAFTYTFDTPGTYVYFCEMHPAMVGSITVVEESEG